MFKLALLIFIIPSWVSFAKYLFKYFAYLQTTFLLDYIIAYSFGILTCLINSLPIFSPIPLVALLFCESFYFVSHCENLFEKGFLSEFALVNFCFCCLYFAFFHCLRVVFWLNLPHSLFFILPRSIFFTNFSFKLQVLSCKKQHHRTYLVLPVHAWI